MPETTYTILETAASLQHYDVGQTDQ